MAKQRGQTKTKTASQRYNTKRNQPRRVELDPTWKVQHDARMAEYKYASDNPANNGNKHKGRDAGAEVMVFPKPMDELAPEEYNALMFAATKRLGLRSSYTSDLPEMLLEHMANGGSLKAFCGRPDVGVTHPVFWGWLKL